MSRLTWKSGFATLFVERERLPDEFNKRTFNNITRKPRVIRTIKFRPLHHPRNVRPNTRPKISLEKNVHQPKFPDKDGRQLVLPSILRISTT